MPASGAGAAVRTVRGASGSLHTPDCDARDGEGHTHWHACGEG
jgi:hypothetical protein